MTAARAAANRPVLSALAVGVLAGLLGILPSLLDGGRLPLQNLWVQRTMPDDMPFALLPVSQYSATTMFALLLMGGVFAGLAVRVIGRRRAVTGWATALGVLLVHAVAVAQSFAVIAVGLGLSSGAADARAVVYFGGMLAGVVASVLFAQLGFWLTSRPSVAFVALGIALAAVPFASWLATGVTELSGPGGMSQPMFLVLRWLPAVIVGVALAWCGVRPIARLVVWAGALLALWVTPALFTAVSYGLGMRVLNGDIAEMAAAASQVFPLALAEGGVPALVAAGIAAVGAGLMALVRTRTPKR
ncbi:MAG: hypothetical protein IR160_08205 [Salinibacterium sp.]|nr:hypothetical protein [Salinibacterium sp.]MBF0672553.1 hypothetical protein [Salinibacterium sp.]